MAVLDTLYILFKGDASSVKKSAGEAETAIKSFLNVFGGIASAATVFAAFKSSINEVTSIGNLSRELNVNVESLDAWGHAVQRTGGTAEQFQSTLKSLSEHFGTTPGTALQLLPKLADTFSRLNQFQANAYGKSLGIDQSTIYLLQQGRREVEDTIRQQKNLGLVTQEQVEITRKYDNALYDAGRAYQTLTRELLIPFVPYITNTINYLIDHQDAVVGAMGAIGLAAALMGIRFAIAFPEIAAVTSAIVAFGLAYEDIKGFIKGDKKTALGLALGVEEGGLKAIGKEKNDESFHLGYFFKRLLGFKNPDNDLITQKLPLINKPYGMENKNTNITVGDITIQTQATDAQGISKDIRSHLSNELFQLNSHIDDGVVA